MKYLLIFWGIPVGSLALWYGLSFNNINFGYIVLSREFNDVVFQIYGQILGIDPSVIRSALIRLLLVDTVIIFAFFYFKPIRRLRALWAAHQPIKHLKNVFATSRKDSSANKFDAANQLRTSNGVDTLFLDVARHNSASSAQSELLIENNLSKAP